MQSVLPELALLFVLLLVNGFFSMSELAVVSARKTRLRELAEDGDPLAARALAVAEEPTRFLSTVQVGITLVGTFTGAIGGAALADDLAPYLADWPLVGPYAGPAAFVLVGVAITLASVVIGELVPKRVALSAPETIARHVAGPVARLSALAHPVVVALTWLTESILKLFGLGEVRDQSVSEGEINDLVQQGLKTGAFNPTESEMVAGVLELDQLGVTAIMTPRPKMVFLNLEDPDEVNWRKIVTSGHSRYPVYTTHRDQVVGVVTVKALWANSAFGLPANLKNVMAPPLLVPEGMTVIHLIEQFRKTGQHLALVTDEFGAIQGLVTLIDVMEAIAGDLPEKGRRHAPEARKRDDGSWLIDATLLIPDFKELLGLDELPHQDTAEYKTAGGFVMTYFGRIPRAGDHFDHAGWRFEVIDMDRHRIDKLLVARLPEPAGDTDRDDASESDAADETRA
ncbi:MAG: hemolysin family protein [Opitutaceae bacterium]|nr:hemolysin family protein [Opitutaceae bacterium]